MHSNVISTGLPLGVRIPGSRRFRSLEIQVDRSFPALFSRNNENGANTNISSSFEAGSRRYRL